MTGAAGKVLYERAQLERAIDTTGLREIQEGLRGVVRLPGGTAQSLSNRDFPIAVMGKTGTTNGFRDALFVGSTFGPQGITVAVRVGFDDNRPLGANETGGRIALPVFREIMLRVYGDDLVGPAPLFPQAIEDAIDAYLAPAPAEHGTGLFPSPGPPDGVVVPLRRGRLWGSSPLDGSPCSEVAPLAPGRPGLD